MAEQPQDPGWRTNAIPFSNEEVAEFQKLFAEFDTLYGEPDDGWPDEAGVAT